MTLHKKIIIGIIIVAILGLAGYLSYRYYFKEMLEGKKEQKQTISEDGPLRGPLTKEDILQKLAAMGSKEEIPMEVKFKTLDKLSDLKSPASRKTTDEERKRILQALSNLK